jgi:hypothetical protein
VIKRRIGRGSLPHAAEQKFTRIWHFDKKPLRALFPAEAFAAIMYSYHDACITSMA